MRLTKNQFYSKPKNSIFGMKRDSPSKLSKLDLSITSSPYKKANI